MTAAVEMVVERLDAWPDTPRKASSGPPTRLEDVPLVLDTSGAAQLLRCSPNLVRELAESGKLPGTKLGKDWRFSRDAVLAALGNQSPPRAQKG